MNDSILTPASANIFEDLGFSPEEAGHLLIRADLMLAIRRHIESQSWTIEQAATEYQVSSDRIKALLKGKINDFTIEQLITWLHQFDVSSSSIALSKTLIASIKNSFLITKSPIVPFRKLLFTHGKELFVSEKLLFALKKLDLIL
jgi:predicted XRE-type DNA-binding protein